MAQVTQMSAMAAQPGPVHTFDPKEEAIVVVPDDPTTYHIALTSMNKPSPLSWPILMVMKGITKWQLKLAA